MIDRLRWWIASRVCDYRGHDWTSWSPYTRGHYAGPLWAFRDTLWLIEVGQRRECQRCMEERFRGVFYDEPHPLPFESKEEKPW